MRLPEELEQEQKLAEKRAPFPYAVYCMLGWAFVFAVYAAFFIWGFSSVPYFFYRLRKTLILLSTWEVFGILTFLRWRLPLGPSGGLMMLYELLFPWKYSLKDNEKRWLS